MKNLLNNKLLSIFSLILLGSISLVGLNVQAETTFEKIKRTGTKEDLVKYKKQIRLIVEKMKEIEKRLKP